MVLHFIPDEVQDQPVTGYPFLALGSEDHTRITEHQEQLLADLDEDADA